MTTERIYKLWDELSDFGMHMSDEAMRHCMEMLCQWVGAENAFWFGSIRLVTGPKARRDPVCGWRTGAICMLDLSHMEKHGSRKNRKGIQTLYMDDSCDTSRALTSRAGEFRVHHLHGGDLVDLDLFKQTSHYDNFYRSLNVSDRIWAAFPINGDAESYFCFDKHGVDRCFCSRDLQLVARTLRGIKWFHRQLLLSHGLNICDEPLTQSERRVLRALLTGASEKAIANCLYLSPGTVHQYAVRIYRKFGVCGRLEFMALWLNSRSQPAK